MKFLADVNIPLPLIKFLMIAIRLMNQKTLNIVSHMEDLLNNQSEDILSKSITVMNEDIADSFPLNENKS